MFCEWYWLVNWRIKTEQSEQGNRKVDPLCSHPNKASYIESRHIWRGRKWPLCLRTWRPSYFCPKTYGKDNIYSKDLTWVFFFILVQFISKSWKRLFFMEPVVSHKSRLWGSNFSFSKWWIRKGANQLFKIKKENQFV